jgi:hypothetical protein
LSNPAESGGFGDPPRAFRELLTLYEFTRPGDRGYSSENVYPNELFLNDPLDGRRKANMTPQDEYQIPDYVAFQVIDGEAIVLDLRKDLYYRLNKVATCIWCAIVDGADVQTARSQMLLQYDVGEDVLCQDINVLVQDLQEAGLLTPVVV